MGKSTLINALLPGAAATIGEISAALRSGRHTTTSTALYRLPGGDGWIVDSPGMKVFGLAHCSADAIAHAFVELRDLIPQCRFRDCRHDREPGCAVQALAPRPPGNPTGASSRSKAPPSIRWGGTKKRNVTTALR